jgi:hypothetical protein
MDPDAFLGIFEAIRARALGHSSAGGAGKAGGGTCSM